jgi:hypothetical protein
MKTIVTLIVLAWLAIGSLAAWQRGYFGDDRDVSCTNAGDTLLTVASGPLNYAGVNPKVDCTLPEPSN